MRLNEMEVGATLITDRGRLRRVTWKEARKTLVREEIRRFLSSGDVPMLDEQGVLHLFPGDAEMVLDAAGNADGK